MVKANITRVASGQERLYEFIRERYNVYLRRRAGASWPWTDDKILQQYRFCNVMRNLDKETVLLHENWLAPHTKDKDLWFACVVARLVNWWPTLRSIGYPVNWHTTNERFVDVIDARKAGGLKAFTGAYMVRADAHQTGSKAAYLADFVLEPMWRDRKHIRPREGDTLQAFHARLMLYRDMGNFMAGQVVADAKYFDTYLTLADDWSTWACSGPGSLRGLNRVRGREPNASWTKHGSWETAFHEEREAFLAMRHSNVPELSGQDFQNCLCEFDKYERVRLGQGKPRSLYSPPKEPT